MMTKTGTIGYLGSFKVPEVVMGVNAFALAAQAVQPDIKIKLVMIDSWFDPAKEAAAAETLTNLGCDVITTHTDSPAALQVCEKKKVYGFGQGADMSRFAPHASLTAIEDIWGPYYISRAKAMLDGSWKSDDAWWGVKEGSVKMLALQQGPARRREGRRRQDHERLGGRLLRSLHRPDLGSVRQGNVAKGVRMEDKDLAVIDWYVKGVEAEPRPHQPVPLSRSQRKAGQSLLPFAGEGGRAKRGRMRELSRSG